MLLTTIYDPNGTPTPYYNIAGLAILPVLDLTSASSDTDFVQVVTPCNDTVVPLKNNAGSDRTVQLPAGAIVGDWVEFYIGALANTNNQINIAPPSGETLNGGSDSTYWLVMPAGSSPPSRVVCRKIAPSTWVGALG